MKDKWNERYANEAYAYGEQANEYLKQCLIQFSPGKVLFPAEGEGRNAVFAAQMGWDVSAFDLSDEGQKKAMKLAEKKNATINYQVGDYKNMNFQKGEFDAIALIYAHFPAAVKSAIHKDLAEYLSSFYADSLHGKGFTSFVRCLNKDKLSLFRLCFTE